MSLILRNTARTVTYSMLQYIFASKILFGKTNAYKAEVCKNVHCPTM